MGRLLEEPSQSVLSQDYPNIEHLVRNASSADKTLTILEKYRGKLDFHSGPDRGTADAINKGFARSHGSGFADLQAGGLYLPGARSAANRALASEPDAGVVYGDANWVDEQGRVLAQYPVRPYDAELLSQECF